jgi:arylsulfatase A-like enzyme
MEGRTASGLSRRRFLSLATAVPPGGAAGKRPNLIVLVTDDQRWDTLGCMGNRIIETPNIDRMAAAGVVFTNHFVTTSICMSSRASLFTGLYLRSHRINDFQTAFSEPQYARTYPEILRRAGYRTGFIGKWGVGDRMPADRFDYFRGFPGQGHYFPKRPDESVHLTELMGDQAVDFLRGSTPSRPFCLSVSFKAPHVQDEDPRQFLHSRATAELYRDVEIPLPKTADPRYIAMLPLEVQRSEARRRWAVRFSTPALYQQSVRAYYRLITEVDTVVGRIREQLGRLGAEDNTVILFTSDNGFYLGEHGLAGKWFMHEESIRVPMIVFDPRLPPSRRGQRRREMTLNIDLAPTILSLAGAPAPPMQGRDLKPLVEGQTVAWRTEFFYEHLFEHAWIPRTEGVRTAEWKYTRYLDTQPPFEELYDLSADPLEERNLMREGGRADQAARLRERWKRWRRALEAWPGDRPWNDPL